MNVKIRPPSRQLTFDDAVAIWPRLRKGEFQNRIATDHDVNPGQISKIKTETRFPGSREVTLRKRVRS